MPPPMITRSFLEKLDGSAAFLSLSRCPAEDDAPTILPLILLPGLQDSPSPAIPESPAVSCMNKRRFIVPGIYPILLRNSLPGPGCSACLFPAPDELSCLPEIQTSAASLTHSGILVNRVDDETIPHAVWERR